MATIRRIHRRMFPAWAPTSRGTEDKLVSQPQPDYRYVLTRRLHLPSSSGVRRTVLFCLLNPSTADETKDDPTIRRVVSFARRDGYGHLSVVNLYGARSTDPKALASFHDPIGPDNDNSIHKEAAQADLVVAAWGVPPPIPDTEKRARQVLAMLTADQDVYRLGKPTKDGHPPHPLYLRKDTPLQLHAIARRKVATPF